MDRAHWVALLLIVGVIAFQVRVTHRVWRSEAFEKPQKIAQSKLIWLLPLIGAVLVASVLEDEDQRGAGPPAGLGR